MKFAVVEYTSKSGNIWRATPARPNYLEDPQHVIDPTSFGGYVSALQGEHIPLTLFAARGVLSRGIKKITGWWPPDYPIHYFKKFNALLVVHQLSNAHEIARFTSRVRQAYPNLCIIGVPTQPYGLLRDRLASSDAARRYFTEYLKHCHVFLTVVKSTLPWYASLTDTPVVYLPQIYPAHFAARFAKSRSHKEPAIFVAGVTDRPHISRGFRVASALQRQSPHVHVYVTHIPGVALDTRELLGCRYTVVPFQPWREHLPWLAAKLLVINTDYTFTRGRVQVDSAAVGTPSLGANSDGQADLFPDLAATPDTPLSQLVALGRRLLTDDAYYDRLVNLARDRLQKYDYAESAARLMMLVKSLKII